MSGYLRHIELSRQLEEKAKEASRNRKHAEERIQQLEGLIGDAKKADCQITDAEELLAQASSAMAAKDFKLALDKTQEGEDKAKAAFLQEANSILEASESFVSLLQRAEADTAEYEALLGSAREALDKGSFGEGVETARRSWTKLEKTLHEHLSRSFSSVQTRILAAKAMEKDTAMAEDLLSRARSALEATEYEDALTHTEEALDILGRELGYELETEEKVVREFLEAGRALKANIAKAEGYLEKGKKELEGGDYQKSFNYLKQARGEAERQLQKAFDSGKASLQEPLEEARKLGVDVTQAEAAGEEAMEAAKTEDYGRASNLLREALQGLEGAKFRLVLDTISASRPKFLRAKEMNVNIESTMEIFNKAREKLQDGKHTDALYYAEKGNEELDKLVGEVDEAASRTQELEAEIGSFADQGLELSEVQSLLVEAKARLSAGDLKAWASQLKKVEKGLEKARTDRCGEMLDEVQFIITLADKSDLDMDEATVGIQECTQLLKSKEVSKALTEATKLQQKTEARLTSHFRAKLESLKDALPPTAAAHQVSELLLKVETALDVRDYGTAARLAEEAEEKAEGLSESFGTRVLEGLQAAQELATEHDLNVSGLRETYLAAKEALEKGELRALFRQVDTVRETLAHVTQRAFDEVKARVIEARNAGIDIAEEKELLKAAKEAITGGDISQGLIDLRACDESAKAHLDAFQQVRDTMGAAAVLVAEGKKKDVNMARAVELLLKGKTAFETGDVERALETARDARAEAEKAISVLNVNDRLVAAEESLALARSLEVDVDPWVNLLARSKRALDHGDFREAVELAMEVEAQTRAGVLNSVNSRVARSESMLEKVQVPAQEIGALEAALKETKAFLEERKLKEAADRSHEILAQSEALAELYDEILQDQQEADTLIADLQALSIKVSAPEKLLAKAAKALNEGRLSVAKQFTGEALGQLAKDRKESIERMIKGFEVSAVKAKKEGVATAEAEALLKQARTELAEGHYQQSLASAMKSEVLLEKMGLQREIAQNSLETTRERIHALPTQVDYLQKILMEAEKAFEAGDYVKSLEVAINASDELGRIKEEWEVTHASEEVALRDFNVADALGLDCSQLSLILDEARAAAKKGDMAGAKESYDRMATEASGMVSTYLTDLHSKVRNARVLSSLLDCEVEGIEDRLSEGLAYLEEDQFVSAHQVLSGALVEVQRALEAKIEGVIAKAEERLDHAAEVGADMKGARRRIEEAKAALQGKTYETAVRAAQEATESLESLEESARRFVEVTSEAKSLISTARKFGISVRPAEESLGQAMAWKDENPEAALENAERGLEQVREAIDAFTPTLELSLDVSGPVMGKVVDATLRVRNASKALAKDLEVEVLGDLEVKDLDVPPSVRANGEVALPFTITFRSHGDVPVLVKAKARRLIDDEEYEWEQVVQVAVANSA
ncbi:MAG: hypothetical protein ACE5LS_04475 [Thermoplasmata archaeon]